MSLKTLPWNPTDLLDSDDTIAAYLDAAFEDGDPKVIAVALGNIARAKGMSSVASQAGVSREALYKALSEKGDPKLSTLLGVMNALGLRVTVSPKQTAA